jgi:uncharacterized membrane protein
MKEEQALDRLRPLILFLDRFILLISRHWLLLFNLTFGVYVGLPMLAPLLMAWGQVRVANLIYFGYQYVCHQMPSRSFFIGPFQMALCERDVALYGGAFLAGLVFALVRERVRPLPVRVWIMLIAPLVLDGSTQLVGLRLSTWELRTVTGLLASAGTVWLVYPYLEQAFQDVAASAGRQVRKVEVVEEERG